MRTQSLRAEARGFAGGVSRWPGGCGEHPSRQQGALALESHDAAPQPRDLATVSNRLFPRRVKLAAAFPTRKPDDFFLEYASNVRHFLGSLVVRCPHSTKL